MSECQMHGDLIHVPPSELHALTSSWPFSVWGIDIIGKISPKSSSGHEGEVDTLIQEYGIQHHRSSAGLIIDPRGKFGPTWSGAVCYLRFDPRESSLADKPGRKSVYGACQCGSVEEVLCVIHGLFFLHFTLSHRLPSSPVSVISIRFTSISYYVMMTCSCPGATGQAYHTLHSTCSSLFDTRYPGSLSTSLFSSYSDLLRSSVLGGVVRHCHA
ncbi:hypothetical protein CK203_043103 [Vitis vinifera]|uniref:Uncharacterized protein n=1 Tax=Vitis vinifera TaxID=29760 RepID=A0A438GXA4_VITVI|nr:hypothetical protein CK203_043103 [Vitis vinifera]